MAVPPSNPAPAAIRSRRDGAGDCVSTHANVSFEADEFNLLLH
jgi:hypothetical protein